jgi:hypothetical protein
MGITEQELREHLAAAASQAAEPGFTLEHIASGIIRKRRRITVMALAGLAAVVALAVSIPLATGGNKPGPMEVPPSSAPSVHFVVSVNGHHGYHRGHTFVVRPGELVTIDVEVTVPRHATVTALWLGISTGTYGVTHPRGTYGNVDLRPIGIRQMLEHARQALRAGRHTFTLKWTAPVRQTAQVPLAGDWAFTTQGPPYQGTVAELIAQFDVVRSPVP